MNQDDLRLEDEIRSMFAQRSERVRASYSPYRAVAFRIAEARKRRRQRVGGSLLAAVVVTAGVGAWAFQNTGARSLPPAGQPGGTQTKYEYADGTPIPPDGAEAGAMEKAADDYLAEMGQARLAHGGYTVVTTFDRSMMADAEQVGDAMSRQQASGSQPAARLAFASVDVATGQVRAFYGGAEAFADGSEIGDLMKPVVVAAALDTGRYTKDSEEPATASRALYYPIGSKAESGHLTYVDTKGRTLNWPPSSEDAPSTSLGADATLAEGVRWSLNSVVCDLELEPDVTPQQVYTFAQNLGIPGSTQDFAPRPSLCVGTAAPSPAQVAGVYATFGAGGVHTVQSTVVEVLDASGRPVWKPSAATAARRIMQPSTASQITDILRAAVSSGTASTNADLRAYALGHPGVAGKTSTTDYALSAWFTGYSGGLSTAVVFQRSAPASPPANAGRGDEPHIQGSGLPATVWARFMTAVKP